jgi:predicted ATP-dependent serine protease
VDAHAIKSAAPQQFRCQDCRKELNGRHGNCKRCNDCRILHRRWRDKCRPSRLAARVIVAYMERNTPGALAKIKANIYAERF